MGRLKILELDIYMDDDITRESIEERSKKLSPIFCRNGLYYDRIKNIAWIEYGKDAWEYSVSDFKYQLRLFTALEFTKEEGEGLTAICKTKFATKAQRECYYSYKFAVEYREFKRRIALEHKKILNKKRE